MFVSKALQKAKVIVNEEGTKAAAATSKFESGAGNRDRQMSER